MKVKYIKDEVFQDYKKPSMLIAACDCDFKCGEKYCQNSSLQYEATVNVPNERIYEKYINNSITEAIVIGGLEPMLQFMELCNLIEYFRSRGCEDEFVIYTGYDFDDIRNEIETLKTYGNIILKLGAYNLDSSPRYDEVLGVELASKNQYAIRL